MASDRGIAAALLGLSLVTRFAMLNYPREVVFDEYHFGKFVNGYIKGEYFFDIHPPLGKLVLALAAWLGGYDGSQGWQKISEPIPASVNLFALRAAPALQGALLSPLVYLAGRHGLNLSQPAALLAAAGALLDLCCLVEQRLCLTDATLLLGIVLQLYGSFASDRSAPLSRAWLVSTAIAGAGIAMAICTKWTGASTIVVAGVHSAAALVRGRLHRRARLLPLFKEAIVRAALLLVAPLVVYFLCGWAHLALLPNTGPGARFMTAAFRATLRGDTNASGLGQPSLSLAGDAAGDAEAAISPSPPLAAAAAAAAAAAPGLFAKFIELNKEMYRANSSINKQHRWGSRWWEWPLMLRSVLYWTGREAPYVAPPSRPYARIYCMGNPAVWWLAALAPVAFLAVKVAAFLRGRTKTKAADRDGGASPPVAAAAAPAASEADGEGEGGSASADKGAAAADGDAGEGRDGAEHETWEEEDGTGVFATHGWLLLLGYIVNWLPFILIARVAFLYHFLPTLLHALLLTGLLLDLLLPSAPLLDKGRRPTDERLVELVDPSCSGAIFAGDAHAQDGPRWLASGALIAAMAASFGFFAPLAYGISMSEKDFYSRIWVQGWQ